MFGLSPAEKLWRLAVSIFLFTSFVGCGGGSSQSGNGGGGGGGGITTPATLTLSFTNHANTFTIYPGTTFSIPIQAAETGTTVTPTVTLGTLPTGLSATQAYPLSVPTSGALVTFTASPSLAAGTYTISIQGTAGTASSSVTFGLTVNSGTPPGPSFGQPQFVETVVRQGSSAQTGALVIGNAYMDVSLSVAGLPSGVTASVQPAVAEPGESCTITLTAAANAPVTQNVQWTLVGTPQASIPAVSTNLLLDVVPATGVGWTSRTTYASTRATPAAAVYDANHQLIYVSNPTWSSVNLISDSTHAIVKSIPLSDTRGMDISQDGSTVWVATASQIVYGINTTTYQVATYQLPNLAANTVSASGSWEGYGMLALADGTLLVEFSAQNGQGPYYAAVWNPATLAFTQVLAPTTGVLLPPTWGAIARSGDGKVVFSAGMDEDETSFSYNVAAKSTSAPIVLAPPGAGYAGAIAVNQDGSRFSDGSTLYDGSFNVLGSFKNLSALAYRMGGATFSANGANLYAYVLTQKQIPLALTINVANQQVTSTSPAMALGGNPAVIGRPFAVDASGMILSVELNGIGFDDAAVNLNYSNSLAVPQLLSQLGETSGSGGPLAGGTLMSSPSTTFAFAPAAYFGATQGQSTLSAGALQLTSPAASAPGPVDIKLLFPDGIEAYEPQQFSYGVTPLDAILSGSSPSGGAGGELDAFGLPLNVGNDGITIGGVSAPITSPTTQNPAYTGDDFTATSLAFNFPPNTPGWADLVLTSASGSGTLPKSIFYAQSVTDYATSDTLSFALYDSSRNYVYLSAGDHIDVFSASSGSFLTPLQPPAVGSKKQFEGLALTPNGQYLLAADLADGSLAAINPTTPSDNFVVSLVTQGNHPSSCTYGPLMVAADNLSHAYVVYGALVGPLNCGPGGLVSEVNLTAKTSSALFPYTTQSFVAASSNGSVMAFGGGIGSLANTLFNPTTQGTMTTATLPVPIALSISGDGNVLSSGTAFISSAGYVTSRMATPPLFYPNGIYAALENPSLNASGSLYYWAYPNYVDIVDVQHGISRLRFSLNETVTKTESPMAIDAGGQHIFLITNKGLTVVDLGNAPLSVGHLSQTTASPGNQIAVRGSGFENRIVVTVGSISASVSYTDSQTLTITVPNATTGLQDLVLTNPDGTTYTLVSAINIQ